MGAFKGLVRYVYVGLPMFTHTKRPSQKTTKLHPPKMVEKVGSGSQLLRFCPSLDSPLVAQCVRPLMTLSGAFCFFRPWW